MYKYMANQPKYGESFPTGSSNPPSNNAGYQRGKQSKDNPMASRTSHYYDEFESKKRSDYDTKKAKQMSPLKAKWEEESRVAQSHASERSTSSSVYH
jgi:hypothetical protein